MSMDRLGEVEKIFNNCKQAMESQRIYQWTNEYPTVEHIEADIKNEHLYGLFQKDKCLGVICINSVEDDQYKEIPWAVVNGDRLIVHRLAIDPLHHGNGFGTQLMNFAEARAFDGNYTSIRLDTYSGNKVALNFYLKRNYEKRGEVYFPGRDLPFFCMEKSIGL